MVVVVVVVAVAVVVGVGVGSRSRSRRSSSSRSSSTSRRRRRRRISRSRSSSSSSSISCQCTIRIRQRVILLSCQSVILSDCMLEQHPVQRSTTMRDDYGCAASPCLSVVLCRTSAGFPCTGFRSSCACAHGGKGRCVLLLLVVCTPRHHLPVGA